MISSCQDTIKIICHNFFDTSEINERKTGSAKTSNGISFLGDCYSSEVLITDRSKRLFSSTNKQTRYRSSRIKDFMFDMKYDIDN